MLNVTRDEGGTQTQDQGNTRTENQRFELIKRYWGGQHRIFQSGDDVPLTTVRPLGKGSFGVVEEVKDARVDHTFVRKRCRIVYSERAKLLKIMAAEAEIWKPLNHAHIVRLIGTYEDEPSSVRHGFSLLVFPAGELDLRQFLDILGSKQSDAVLDAARFGENGALTARSSYTIEAERACVQQWFECLASALEYLHGQHVRHHDIKPQNIICKNTSVYLTDFGTAQRFSMANQDSTEGPVWTTKQYGAPEIIDAYSVEGAFNRYGAKSDIFSLGCVFLEMLAILQGNTLSEFHRYCVASAAAKNNPWATSLEPNRFIYSSVIPYMHPYFTGGDARFPAFYLLCIAPMVKTVRQNRPSATEALSSIRVNKPWISIDCECNRLAGYPIPMAHIPLD
jgi:serine/threonine protein kinase